MVSLATIKKHYSIQKYFLNSSRGSGRPKLRYHLVAKNAVYLWVTKNQLVQHVSSKSTQGVTMKRQPACETSARWSCRLYCSCFLCTVLKCKITRQILVTGCWNGLAVMTARSKIFERHIMDGLQRNIISQRRFCHGNVELARACTLQLFLLRAICSQLHLNQYLLIFLKMWNP